MIVRGKRPWRRVCQNRIIADYASNLCPASITQAAEAEKVLSASVERGIIKGRGTAGEPAGAAPNRRRSSGRRVSDISKIFEQQPSQPVSPVSHPGLAASVHAAQAQSAFKQKQSETASHQSPTTKKTLAELAEIDSAIAIAENKLKVNSAEAASVETALASSSVLTSVILRE